MTLFSSWYQGSSIHNDGSHGSLDTSLFYPKKYQVWRKFNSSNGGSHGSLEGSLEHFIGPDMPNLLASHRLLV